MKRLKSIENDQVQLEVMECDCGFHLGIDFTYLDQIKVDIVTNCPSCNRLIETKKIFPEDREMVKWRVDIVIRNWTTVRAETEVDALDEACESLKTQPIIEEGDLVLTKED